MSCYECAGAGTVIACIDDLCQGGWCIHGDGAVVCPVCLGEDGPCCEECGDLVDDCVCWEL